MLELPLVVVVGGPDQRPAEPREREDRPLVPDGHDRARNQRQRLVRERHVRPPAGSDPRHLLLRVDLLGADPVRPYAGRVHDVRRPNLEAAAGHAVHAAHASRARAVLHQADHLAAVRHHRAEPLGLAEDGQHEAGVVGLAVVEEIGGRRLARGERWQEALDLLALDHVVAVGAPLLERGRVAAAPQARQPHALGGHHVVHVQPHARQAVGAVALEGGYEELERPHQVRGEVHEQGALEQRLPDKAEIEVLEVAEAAVHELRRAARGA